MPVGAVVGLVVQPSKVPPHMLLKVEGRNRVSSTHTGQYDMLVCNHHSSLWGVVARHHPVDVGYDPRHRAAPQLGVNNPAAVVADLLGHVGPAMLGLCLRHQWCIADLVGFELMESAWWGYWGGGVTV